jgi:membrane-bound lytic murein transglycosylase B
LKGSFAISSRTATRLPGCRCLLALTMLALTMLGTAAEAAQTPAQWVNSFWPTARAAGVSRPVFDAALGNFTPDPEVLKKAATQAEFNTPVWYYMDMMVSDDRIVQGKAALAQYSDSLARLEAQYGVDRYTIVAVWGIESHYGSVFDNPKLFKGTIRSLATLAYSGGRLGKFGREQLVAALRILQRGDVSARGMIGSWAGAMGQTQFIPTTYNAYAVDFDHDGHRNIWTSPVDALASTANYLRASGWQAGRTWGYEVILPKSFNARKGGARSLGEWDKLGVDRAGGKTYPRAGDKASLFRPAGAKGPSFLVMANFRVIMRYNSSTSYALAVGHLADRLRGGDTFATAWPAHEPPLSLADGQKLQQLLTARGYYSGDIDGNLGSGTRQAIRDYQLAIGVTPDGIGTRRLLQLLEAKR